MSSEIKFTREPGDNKSFNVTLYAISTCGFCRSAIAFLKNNSIEFEYLYVDNLEKNVRKKLIEELKEKYMQRAVFPFLVVDDEKVEIGYKQSKYKKLFGIK